MTLQATAASAGSDARGTQPIGADRWAATCWGLLMVNVLGFVGVALIVPFPRPVGQLVTMGSLIAAFAIAVLRNPRLQLRPSVTLTLASALVLAGLASSLRLEAGYGALFRSGRGIVFVATLWLLTPCWRSGLAFVRFHVRALLAILAVVLAGLAVAPGKAMSGPPDGRLQGTFWPIQPPQVGQYAAVAAGLVLVLWLVGLLAGRTVLWLVPALVGILLLTHTRTALAGFVVAVLLAAASQAKASARARRFLACALGGGLLGALVLGPIIVHWLSRGQDSEELASLTGRQKTWDALLAHPRSLSDRWLGEGLGNKSFGGLPIDSAWLSTYHEQGLVGVCIVAAVLASLVLGIALRPPSPARACAVFLVGYVLVASYTEVGLGDVNAYLMHLVVAAAALKGADLVAPSEEVR